MKIRINVRDGNVVSPGYVAVSLDELGMAVDDGEATEIIAYNVIDCISHRTVDDCLDAILRKLAHGGLLVISACDYQAVARAITQGRLNPEEVNDLLYGPQDAGFWSTRKSAYSMDMLVNYFKHKGYTIESARFDLYQVVLSIRRP
jgi:hypothetical protein